MPGAKTLMKKLLEVRKSVTYLKKDKQNMAQRYRYVSHSAVVEAVRDALDDAGVLLVPRIVEESTENVGKQIMTKIKLEYTWVDADNPEDTLICQWRSQGLDMGEKGIGKALVYGEKNFLLRFFNIPTDEYDPDNDAAEARRQQREQRKREESARTQNATPTPEPKPLTVEQFESKPVPKAWLPKEWPAGREVTFRDTRNPEVKFAIVGNKDMALISWCKLNWENSADTKQRKAYELLRAKYPSKTGQREDAKKEAKARELSDAEAAQIAAEEARRQAEYAQEIDEDPRREMSQYEQNMNYETGGVPQKGD